MEQNEEEVKDHPCLGCGKQDKLTEAEYAIGRRCCSDLVRNNISRLSFGGLMRRIATQAVIKAIWMADPNVVDHRRSVLDKDHEIYLAGRAFLEMLQKSSLN